MIDPMSIGHANELIAAIKKEHDIELWHIKIDECWLFALKQIAAGSTDPLAAKLAKIALQENPLKDGWYA